MAAQQPARTSPELRARLHSARANVGITPRPGALPHEVLMLSVRMRDRALPVAWRVRKTKGNIGFSLQKELLDSIQDWMPEGADVMLTGDRFYGTERLIHWCQDAGWGYRIRLKGNLTL